MSVVISTYQEGEALAATVRSVSHAVPRPREIVVVDDGSTDGSAERDWPDHVTLVRQAHRGIAAARNHGARVASQPALVFLDAHCGVADGWLDPLLDVLDEEPEAVAGPAVRDAEQPDYVGCGARIVDALFTYRWQRVPDTACAHVPVGVVPGGCLAVNRRTFADAGGFAPFTGFGVEDVEISLRWWRAGRPLLGVPASQVAHRFRAAPPYRPDHASWLRNVLRTALLHLTGERLRVTVLACARFSSFNRAVADVLAERWAEAASRLAVAEVRQVVSYLDTWAPAAFPAQACPNEAPRADGWTAW
ncbi:glycosyltransferase [Microbispora sp. H10836]|uniref:glycosyltransferase n=1 Tax=Microbispora sp. H10836 TaxID=2729106 RepID=UPI001474C033|nr:glycosyltransferase [Microbispora sp. H10836]